ncbi:unnamed protein product, partial [marine sediment metagenome]
MRKSFLGVVFPLLIAVGLGAQDTQILLDTFKSNFKKAEELSVKLRILQDSIKAGSHDMGSMYHLAVDYVVDNSSLLDTESLMKEIALLAVQQVKEAGYDAAKYSLWRLFRNNSDTTLRVSILNSLGVIAQRDSRIIKGIIEWLSSQNFMLGGKTNPDNQVVAEAVKTLGTLKDSSAFHALFTTMELKYSKQITSLAKQALLSLEGELKANLMGVIRNGTISDKVAALRMVVQNDKLEDNHKAEAAELALE